MVLRVSGYGRTVSYPSSALLPGAHAMMADMDRQVRNVGLITLLLAALTIVAVVSPEHHRSTTNTLILDLAVVAAVGSVIFLVGSAVPVRVIARDIHEWRERRRLHMRWRTHHYLAVDQDRTIRFPKDDAIRSPGRPCIVLVLEPPGRLRRRRGKQPETGPERLQHLHGYMTVLKGLEIECSVGSGQDARDVGVSTDPRAALARFPDEWFGQRGRYRARWTITMPSGDVEEATDTIRLGPHGRLAAAPLRRGLMAMRRFVRHLRGLD